ncbi:MAG: ABC transporter substrate-binding protein [Alphaproteobacteria bacterium]
MALIAVMALTSAPALASDIPVPKLNGTAAGLLPEAVKSRGEIHVVSTFGYAPQQYFGEDGKTPLGFSVDLAKSLGAAVGLPMKFTNGRFDSIIPGLEAGRFDMAIAAMSATAERGGKVHFLLYQHTDARLLVRGGNPANIKTLVDLCGRKVASLKGSLYNQVIDAVSVKCKEIGKPAVELSTYDSSDSVVQALISGRADASYRDSAPIAVAAKASEGKLQVVGPEYPDTTYGVAFANDNLALAKSMTAAMQAIMADGTYKAILDKWGLGSRAVKSAELIESGSPASAYPRSPSAADIAFGKK